MICNDQLDELRITELLEDTLWVSNSWPFKKPPMFDGFPGVLYKIW